MDKSLNVGVNIYKKAARKSHILKKIKRSRYLYLLFFLPAMYYIIFKYIPMVGIIISFKDYNPVAGIFKSPWVGLKHYRSFLTDPYFWMVFKNTIIINLYQLFWAFPAPIILAILLNELMLPRFKKLVQTVSYLPHFLSTVVVCGMVVNFLASEGIVNQLLSAFGLEPVLWLMHAKYFREGWYYFFS